MNKFKFGDKVWHEVPGEGVVISDSNEEEFTVHFKKFPDDEFTCDYEDGITLATDWVKCSERMPERGQRVLWNVKGVMAVGHHFLFGFQDEIHLDSGGYFIVENMDDAEWMPLPTVPQEI